MKRTPAYRPALLLLVAFFASAMLAHAAPAPPARWVPIGPEGGDARAFATDPANPAHIYLGTLSGWLYESQDTGGHWTRLANIADRSDLVLDNIIVDPVHPSNLLIGAWVLGNGAEGGLYHSSDAGHTWTPVYDMKNQSIRALTMAPSDPKIIIAGTLTGVYRTTDGGEHWTSISPPQNAEIHEVESIAIDPKNPDIIYAGTWHLPWKTTDGGKTWNNIKQGLIDDSDVFSIIVDPVAPSTVYLSACSGIYKSVDAGNQFTKIQGIPSTARRTRVLQQDPINRNVVYAGTTEGLYKTTDAGHAWVRMTSPDVIVNDIYIGPKDNARVLLATDRSGVLDSHDSGASFVDANRGIMQRQVSALIVDPTNPRQLYVGVLNDKTYGGVFSSEDGGSTWTQRSTGLAGRDVYSLAITPQGFLLAGTNHGLASYKVGSGAGGVWQTAGKVVTLTEKKTHKMVKDPKTKKLVRQDSSTQVPTPAPDITARVSSVSIAGKSWYAASTAGLYRSSDQGATWVGGPLLGETELNRVAAHDELVFVSNIHRLFVSQDDGGNWRPSLLPDGLSRIAAIAISPDGVLWIAGPEGVWISKDTANTWERVKTLPINDINSLIWDPSESRMMVTSWKGGLFFGSNDDAASWKYWSAGWELRGVRSAGGHLIGASLFNGVVMDPAGVAWQPPARSPATAAGQ
jgi:photosystem II stability/assembly factor-like uncharacterized protein